MTEKPITFSGPMVRAILEGKKTQTRRVVTPQPEEKPPGSGYWYARPRGYDNGAGVKYFHTNRPAADRLLESCAPYAKGDTLWIRETHAVVDPPDGSVLVVYRASCENDCFTWVDAENSALVEFKVSGWRSPRFMPKDLARTTRLRITGVRVECLHEITADDARAEGMRQLVGGWVFVDDPDPDAASDWHADPIDAFRAGWDTLNGKRAPWASNPWVWVVSFEVAGG